MRHVWTAAALVVLGVAATVPAQERKAPGGKPDRLPGDSLWDFGAWADDYTVVGTAYDARAGQVVWTLEARKKVSARRYRARFFDPDLLEMADNAIQLSPAQKEYAKGSRIKATLKLPPKDVMKEVNRVRIDAAN